MDKKEFFQGAHKFTNKVIDGAEKVVDGAGKHIGKAKGAVSVITEQVKLEWELAEAKNTLKELYAEYGEMCFSARSVSDETSKTENGDFLIDLIEEKQTRIEKIEQQLSDIKEDKRFCTGCGAEATEKNDKFCSKCGKELK